jgi:hypothetical protein
MLQLIDQAMEAVWAKPLRRLAQSRLADLGRIAN